MKQPSLFPGKSKSTLKHDPRAYDARNLAAAREYLAHPELCRGLTLELAKVWIGRHGDAEDKRKLALVLEGM